MNSYTLSKTFFEARVNGGGAPPPVTTLQKGFLHESRHVGAGDLSFISPLTVRGSVSGDSSSGYTLIAVVLLQSHSMVGVMTTFYEASQLRKSLTITQ